MTNEKIKINHFSSADTVPGQGVGSAYLELINLFKTNSKLKDDFDLRINKIKRSDISHYHTIDPWFLLTTFLPGRGVKVGYVHFLPETIQGSINLPKPLMKIFGWYIIYFYRRMDKLVVVNPSFKKELVKAELNSEKIEYIPNFVNPKNFHLQTKTQINKNKKKLEINSKKPIIFGVGQVQTRKGILTFVELAKNNPNWQFIWAGGFSFGAATDGYKELNKIVKNPPENLRFTGIIDRKALNDYYNLADIFLLPSYSELFPMSILEAFATHTPVVVRDLDLYKDILQGAYLSGRNTKEIQAAIASLIKSKTAKDKMINKSKKASEYYSPENIADKWDNFYKSLIKNNE